jgi:hypothetical protein
VVNGFFACGFQRAFISIHRPGHLSLCGMSPGAGANALALIARLFGPRHLGLLFGTAFLSHPLGSLIGAWAGGLGGWG